MPCEKAITRCMPGKRAARVRTISDRARSRWITAAHGRRTATPAHARLLDALRDVQIASTRAAGAIALQVEAALVGRDPPREIERRGVQRLARVREVREAVQRARALGHEDVELPEVAEVRAERAPEHGAVVVGDAGRVLVGGGVELGDRGGYAEDHVGLRGRAVE